MRYVKIVTILFLIFIGVGVSAQAKSGFVPTHEQMAEDMYATFQESTTHYLSDFQIASEEINHETLRQIEMKIAGKFGTSREQVRKKIAHYKQHYVTAIDTEADQLKNTMFARYENEKEHAIQKEMTEDITEFLEALLSE